MKRESESEKLKRESEKFLIVSPHYNLRTTVALLPHNQHTMWTQPECDVVVDDDDVYDDDNDVDDDADGNNHKL